MYTNDNPLKVFTTFSGYDSQCLALKKSNIPFDLVGWSEIEKRAIDAHNLIFPEYKDRNYGDICKIDWNNVPDFELFTYSSPCFVAGTQVWTSQGYKNIEDIVVGDEVLTHTGEYHKVIDTMSHPYAGVMYHIYTDSGIVDCTRDHPFYTYLSGGYYSWTKAKNLDKKTMKTCGIGLYKNGEWTHDTINDISTYFPAMPIIVYNLEVEKDHSYTANNIVVHNCQSFSICGKMLGGEEGSGTKSSLLWECKKAIEIKRPKYLMLENVKNLVSDKFIHTFNLWLDYLKSQGYTNYWKILKGSDYGIPQDRERVFCISIFNPKSNFIFPKGCKLNKSVEDFIQTKEEMGDNYKNIVDPKENYENYIKENPQFYKFAIKQK